MNIEFKQLREVDKNEIIALMNNPLVLRHMPLAKGIFDESAYKKFIATKEALWKQHGYGPWAFVIDGKFAGWGGLQFEEGETEIALVLHPDFWGMGKTIYLEVIRKAFDEMGLESIVVLFPPSRTRIKGFLQLGFKQEGEVTIEGERFLRYRLSAKSFNELRKP